MGDYGIELDGWADYVDARDEERWYDGYEDFQYQQWRTENPEAAVAYDADMAAHMQAELEAERAAAAAAVEVAASEAAAPETPAPETPAPETPAPEAAEAETEAETTPTAPPTEATGTN